MILQESLMEKTLYSSMHELTPDGYESDDTLSLCDLPLHSDSPQTPAESRRDRFPQSSDPDCFEFYTPSVLGFPPESIVFCGKILTHRKQPGVAGEGPDRGQSERGARIGRKRGWGLVRWMASSDRKRAAVLRKKEHLLLLGIWGFSSQNRGVEIGDGGKKQSSRLRRGQPPENGGSGLSRMIRLLSCGGNHHPNTMVAKSTRGAF